MTRPEACPVFASIALVFATAGPVRADVWDVGAATNDNTPLATHNELIHGLEQVHDLGAREGVPDEDFYVVEQGTASFEAIVDSTSADVGGIFSAANFVRLEDDGVTIAQESSSAWGFLGNPGFNRALRWRRGSVTAGTFRSYLRVKATCGGTCTSEDTYRIRFLETTLSIPRFNNSGTQATILIINNPTHGTVSGEIYFIAGSGSLLHIQPLEIPTFGTFVVNTTSIPELQGQSGSARVTHDAGYGELTGKAVALEPATGFVFESPLVPRPH
jgi:hypothetical protein